VHANPQKVSKVQYVISTPRAKTNLILYCRLQQKM